MWVLSNYVREILVNALIIRVCAEDIAAPTSAPLRNNDTGREYV